MKLISSTQKKPLRAQAKITLAGLFCFIALLVIVRWTPAGNPPSAKGKQSRPASSSTPTKTGRPQVLQREGTKIVDRRGHFRIVGDRVVFFSDDEKNRYVTLENLNLERIVQALADQPRRRRWNVTGTLTEFQGENYLLVEKALLESWGGVPRNFR